MKCLIAFLIGAGVSAGALLAAMSFWAERRPEEYERFEEFVLSLPSELLARVYQRLPSDVQTVVGAHLG